MASRPAFGVALIGVTPMTETTPVTSGSLRIASSTCGLQPLHLGERDLLPAFHDGEDEAGVLQRQEALRNDDVEPDGRDQRGRGHHERERLVAQHPFEALAVELHRPVDRAVETLARCRRCGGPSA